MACFLYTLTLLCLSIGAIAQTVVPLTLDGILDSITPPRNASDPRSGGYIIVNGFTITVPDNLLFAFPAAFVPYAQVAAAFPGFGGDYGNEVSIVGNIVNGVAIAGQVTISQLATQFSNGEIESLGFDGTIRIKNGPTIRINDPNGVYSKGYTLKPFYTADDENPSITAFSGFPMCVPRGPSDPLCPSSNRLAGTTFTAPDSLVMSPFAVGDFLDYAGIKVGSEIICYSIVANVMITSTSPGYIRVEDALVGVIDNDPNVEFSTSKFIGYTSNSATTLQISAIDVDPCTGIESDRLIVQGVPVSPNAAPVNRNKWEHKTARLPIGQYVREYHIALSTGTQVTKNNITAGQYRQPVTEWVFPELDAIGAAAPSADFSNFAHLANGFGPDDNGVVFKQLSPWPGRFPAPAPSKSCPDRVAGSVPPTTTTPPTSSGSVIPVTVDAKPNASQRPGTLVQLSAKNTAPDVINEDLTYSWSQVNGTTAVLANNKTATPSFTIPLQTEGIKVRWYAVNMTHTSGSFSVGYVSVISDNSIKDKVVIDSYTRVNQNGGSITVTAHSDLIGDPNASMTIRIGNPTTTFPMTKVGTGLGKWQYTASKISAGQAIVITSSGLGTDTRAAPS